MNARLKSLIHFLDDGIWRIREEEVSHLQWKAYTCLKIIYLSINPYCGACLGTDLQYPAFHHPHLSSSFCYCQGIRF